MAIEPRAMRWRRLYEEVGRANLLLQDVKSRLNAGTEDRDRLARDLRRLTLRGNAALQALSEAYRALSDEHWTQADAAKAPGQCAAGQASLVSGQRRRADT